MFKVSVLSISVYSVCLISCIFFALPGQAADNAPTICLYDSIFLTIGRDYKATAYHRQAFRFGPTADPAVRDVIIAVNNHIRLEQIEITTTFPDGRAIRIADGDIRIISDYGPDYFADSKTIVAPIPFGGEGSVARVSYRIDFDCLLYLPQYFRQQAIPVHNSYLGVKSSVPFGFYSTAGRFEVFDSNDSVTFFAAFIPGSAGKQSGFPKDSYRIVIRPNHFDYEGKRFSSKSWDDVAAFYADISSIGLGNDTVLNNLASVICRTALTALDSAVALNRFVNENIRYISADLGRGDFRPMKPVEVLRRKYGDCRDQSALLVALLEAVGFKAYPVLAATRDRVEIIDTLPWPGCFNHVFVAVENGTPAKSGYRYLFFDPGGRSCCDQVLPTRLRKRLALVCRPSKGSELVLLDSNDLGNLIEINMTFKGMASNISSGEITLNFFRDPAFTVYSPDTAEFSKNVLEQFPVLGGYGTGVRNMVVDHLARDKASIKAKTTGRFFATADGGHLLFIIASPLADFLRRLFDVDITDDVLDIEYPMRLKETISLTLAEGRFAEEDSVSLDFQQGGLQAHFTAYFAGKRCQIYRFINLSRYTYDTEIVRRFSRFIDESSDRLPGRIPIE